MVERRVTQTETIEANTNVHHTPSKVAKYSVVDQLLYLLFGIIEFLLLIRFIFRLTGANPASGIVQFVYGISNILMAPFRFIFPTNQVQGAVFEWSIIVAMIFYALFLWVLMKLISIFYTADVADE